MCIICTLPIGTSISEQEFENCWDNNPDGGGFMYLNSKGNIQVYKSMKYNNLRDAFNKAFTERKEYSPFILHFRIGTHGTKDIDNVHPFFVNPNLAFCHNGIISISGMKKSDPRSDTRVFNDDFMSLLPRNFLKNEGIRRMIQELIGYSKLAFLDTNGNIDIINEKAGITSENRWFSNSSFRTQKYSSYTPYTMGYGNYIPKTTSGTSKPVRNAWDHLGRLEKKFSYIEDYLAGGDEEDFYEDTPTIYLPDGHGMIKCSMCDNLVPDNEYSFKFGACANCYFNYFDDENFEDFNFKKSFDKLKEGYKKAELRPAKSEQEKQWDREYAAIQQYYDLSI